MYDIITFDCYGTLIDWEGGITKAICGAAGASGVEVQPDDVMRAYLEVEPTIQATEYRPYRDVLSEAATKTAGLLGWEIGDDQAGFLAKSLPGWLPFADTNPALELLKQDGYQLGILSNIDNDLLAGTLQHFSVEFDFFVTAEQVRSYKPAYTHFHKASELLAGSDWLHAAQSFYHDVQPACDLGIPVVWVNRNRDAAATESRPIGEVETLAGLVRWIRGGGAQG